MLRMGKLNGNGFSQNAGVGSVGLVTTAFGRHVSRPPCPVTGRRMRNANDRAQIDGAHPMPIRSLITCTDPLTSFLRSRGICLLSFRANSNSSSFVLPKSFTDEQIYPPRAPYCRVRR